MADYAKPLARVNPNRLPKFEFKKTTNKITKTVIDLTSELKSEKSNVRIPSGT